MDLLNQLSLNAIRDRLVEEARSLGVTVEEHAAAEMHDLEAKYGKMTIVAVLLAFCVGLVFGIAL